MLIERQLFSILINGLLLRFLKPFRKLTEKIPSLCPYSDTLRGPNQGCGIGVVLMNNVIAFPRPEAAAPVQARSARPMTLFVHVKCATLIIHLADTQACEVRNERIVKS